MAATLPAATLREEPRVEATSIFHVYILPSKVKVKLSL
jgi:hypothetical protein